MQQRETPRASELGELLLDWHVSETLHAARNWQGTVKRSVILERCEGPVNKLW